MAPRLMLRQRKSIPKICNSHRSSIDQRLMPFFQLAGDLEILSRPRPRTEDEGFGQQNQNGEQY